MPIPRLMTTIEADFRIGDVVGQPSIIVPLTFVIKFLFLIFSRWKMYWDALNMQIEC